jgi:hypothetical protein
LPVLLAELTADIGAAQLGILALHDAHRPERQSVLMPAFPSAAKRRGRAKRKPVQPSKPLPALRKALPRPSNAAPPTRLLPAPVSLEAALRPGATLSIDRRLYSIERVQFEERLDSVEWWSRPVSRDYLRLLLRGPGGVLEALVYVERETGKRFLQAIAD